MVAGSLLLLTLSVVGPAVQTWVGTAPSGVCVGKPVYIDYLGTGIYYCNAGTWASVTPGGGGGGGGAPTTAQYWVGASDGTLSAEKDLSALSTGLVLNTAGTPSAYAGTACTGANLLQTLTASGVGSCLQLRLDQLANPTGDTTFTYPAGKKMLWTFTGASDAGFSIDGDGSFTSTGDLVHIHKTGTGAAAGADALHVEVTSDPVMVGVHITMPGATNDALTTNGKVTASGGFVGALTGNASTASGPDVTPSLCAVGQAARGINSAWGATGCFAPTAAPSSNVEILHSANATAGAPLQNSGTLTFDAAGWSTADSLSYDTQVTMLYVPTARNASTGTITAGTYRLAGAGGTVNIPDTGGSSTTYLRGDGSWSSVTASPAGSSGQIQYNSSGSAAGAANANIDASGYFLLPAAAEPSAPANGVVLWSEPQATAAQVAYKAPVGGDDYVQGSIWNKHRAWTAPTGASAGKSDTGWATTLVGTAAATTATTTNYAGAIKRLTYTSGTTASTPVEMRVSSPAFFWRGNAAGLGGFFCNFRWTNPVHNAGSDKMLVGMVNSVAALAGTTVPSAAATGQTAYAGWDAGGTAISLCGNDGTGSAGCTACNSTDFPVNSTTAVFSLNIFSAPNGSTIELQLKRLDASVAACSRSISTAADLPANTSFLAPRIWGSNGTTAANFGLNFIGMYCETDN